MGVLNRLWHRLALALFVLLGAGLFVAWWLHTYERVSREEPLPPAGEAAYNPLYALRLALRADGVEAVSRQRLDLAAHPPGERDTVLVLGDPGTLAPRDVEALLDWVEGGGHLLVSTPRGRRLSGAQADALLPRIGIDVRSGSGSCERMFVPDEQSHVEFCQGNRFVTRGVDPEYAWGDFAAGFVYARLRRGAGAVDVLASLDFMENDKLAEAPHAALTRQLLDRNYGQGTVHLVYAASMPPLWRLLMERAWMAWLPLALALAAFLWMRLQRVGPVLPRPDDERRSLLEHVQASGEHLRRYGRGALLHGALREAFLDRLHRRDPMAAALEGAARAEAIAARTGVAAADIEYALRDPRPRDRRDFVQRMARLIDLRRRL